MGRLAVQNMLRQTQLSPTRHNYRCKATTKAGTRCKLHGHNGYCHRHRLPTVDEELAAERARKE